MDFLFSNNNYRQYFESLALLIPDNVMILDPQTFQIRFINQVRPGNKIKDFINKSVFDSVLPENRDKYRKILTEVSTSGMERSYNVEVPDSTNPEKKLSFHCTVKPIKNDSEEIENLLVISKDVTPERQRERDIANKEGRLFAIINNTKDIILSIDKNLNLIEFNNVFSNLIEHVFGKTHLTGTCILDYVDPKKHEHLKKIYSQVLKGEAIVDIESFDSPKGIIVNHQSTVYNETNYHPILNYDNEIIGISVFSKNITDRINSEQALQNTLKQRDILLSEIHHRIKNNLAVVSSMLHLKELSLDNTDAIEVLAESRNRIKSTALVHEMLYKNEKFDSISVKDYMTELFKNVSLNPKVALQLEGLDVLLGLEKAFPFGLLMHELIMNSIKHSFNGEEAGQLKIAIRDENNILHLEYSDCTGKFPEEIDFYDTSTTGLMLIHTFIHQLDGSISLIDKEPPSYHIEIPLVS